MNAIDEYELKYSTVISGNACDFNLPIAEATVCKLICHKQSLSIFLEPGDNLQISFAGDSLLQSVSFSGKGSENNTFLNLFLRRFHSEYNKEAVTATILKSGADEFEMKLYDGRKTQLDFYNTYQSKNLLSQPFEKYIENTIRYNYYARLLSFPIIQANQSQQILAVKALPAVMLKGIDSTLANDHALLCETYRDFLFYDVVYFTSQANGFEKFKDQSISMERKISMASQNFSGKSLVWYLAWFLNSDIDKVSQYTARHVYTVLTADEKNGTYTHLLRNKVDKRLAVKDAPVAPVKANDASASTSKSGYPALQDIDGKSFTFDDLKGKVVYVDYWASWCGPCRNEMSYSKQLHEMFNEKQLKQLVFLYISIDESADAWRAAVQQIGMQGRLAISPGNWSSPIAKYFQINSIPRYMLIDKKGNIVDVNAKRPSSGQSIYNDILKLIE